MSDRAKTAEAAADAVRRLAESAVAAAGRSRLTGRVTLVVDLHCQDGVCRVVESAEAGPVRRRIEVA